MGVHGNWQAARVGIRLAAALLLLLPATGGSDDGFAARCLQGADARVGGNREPVDVERCLEEFLASGLADRRAWSKFLEQVGEQIYFNQELQTFRIHGSRPPDRRFSGTVAPGGTVPRERRFIASEKRDNVEIPYLGSRKLINVLTLKGWLDGHRDVTMRVLAQEFRFSYPAQLVAADAAEDPDFYSWSSDLAHAQTPANASTGEVDRTDAGDGSTARRAFAGYLHGHVDRVKTFCEGGQAAHALYALGWALHAVQDLAAHNGRTLAEHSWNSYCRNAECDSEKAGHPKCPSGEDCDDPDESAENVRLAELYTKSFLAEVRQYVAADCWQLMRRYDGGGLPTTQKLDDFQLVRDFTGAAIREYREARFLYGRSVKDTRFRVRWIGGPDRQKPDLLRALWGLG